MSKENDVESPRVYEDPVNKDYFSIGHITVAPSLPHVIKEFTKAAIRTQPVDLWAFSEAYFRGLTNPDHMPEIKDRMLKDIAAGTAQNRLTAGLIRLIYTLVLKQADSKRMLPLKKLREIWRKCQLKMDIYYDIITHGEFRDKNIDWLQYISMCAVYISKDMTETMCTLIDVLNHDTDIGYARLPFRTFKYAYLFLAKLDGEIKGDYLKASLSYLEYHAEKNMGFISIENIENRDCPPLDGIRGKQP